jgi:hypothetical protein
MIVRHFCLRIGPFMLRDWHFYCWREHVGKNTTIRWHDWDRVL